MSQQWQRIPVNQQAGDWRKPARSQGASNCIEVGETSGGAVVRDTKDRSGPMLMFAPGPWRAFISRLRRGGIPLENG